MEKRLVVARSSEQVKAQMGMTIKGQKKDPGGGGIVLYLNCISANILVVVLYLFCKMLLLEETGKRILGIHLYIFLKIAYDL